METSKSISYCGIVITVVKDGNKWSVSFANKPGNHEDLQNVSPLQGLDSKNKALTVGKKFVDDHQWQYVEEIGIFNLNVRLYYDNKWGYGVWCSGGIVNSPSEFTSRENATQAGRKHTQKIVALKKNDKLPK